MRRRKDMASPFFLLSRDSRRRVSQSSSTHARRAWTYLGVHASKCWLFSFSLFFLQREFRTETDKTKQLKKVSYGSCFRLELEVFTKLSLLLSSVGKNILSHQFLSLFFFQSSPCVYTPAECMYTCRAYGQRTYTEQARRDGLQSNKRKKKQQRRASY